MPGTKAPARLGSISQNISHTGYKRKSPDCRGAIGTKKTFIKYVFNIDLSLSAGILFPFG